MSDEEIDQSIRNAQQYAGQDQMCRDALKLTGEAQSLLAKAQQALKMAGKQIDKAEKKQIKSDCNALQKLLSKFRVDRITDADVENIRRAKEQLESSSAGIREVYGNN